MSDRLFIGAKKAGKMSRDLIRIAQLGAMDNPFHVQRTRGFHVAPKII